MTDLTIGELDAIRAECRSRVIRRAAMSGVVAATPIPFVDAAADVGILLKLLPRISSEFRLTRAEIDDLDPESRAVVYASIMKLGDTLVGRLITRKTIGFVLNKLGMRIASKSVARFAPLIGQATAATISFWMMRYIGLKHVEDCYAVARARTEGRIFGDNAIVIDSTLDGDDPAAGRSKST